MPTGYNAGDSLRERLLHEAREWVYNNVPKHTQAAMDTLLATNQDLAIELINKWRELEDLRAAYYALQDEVAKDVAPLPPVEPNAEMYRDVRCMETVMRVEWAIPRFYASFAVSDIDRMRDAGPARRAAFKRMFMEQYVPELWKQTEYTLFSTEHQVAA
ncbi:MAG: hypothetical protein AAGL96_13320 [Pseudomonadota bacterium]